MRGDRLPAGRLWLLELPRIESFERLARVLLGLPKPFEVETGILFFAFGNCNFVEPFAGDFSFAFAFAGAFVLRLAS